MSLAKSVLSRGCCHGAMRAALDIRCDFSLDSSDSKSPQAMPAGARSANMPTRNAPNLGKKGVCDLGGTMNWTQKLLSEHLALPMTPRYSKLPP